MRSRVSGPSDLLAPPSWGELMQSQEPLAPALPPSTLCTNIVVCDN
jgi:hypothetical protein